MPRHHSLLIIVGMTFLLAGCTADLASKLGGPGEVCGTDNDCQDGLVCTNDSCVDGGGQANNGNNGGNNGGTNSSNNSGNNHVASDCAEVCLHLERCVGYVEDCEDECKENTAHWDSYDREEAFLCMLNLSCDELRQGFGDECVEDIDEGGRRGHSGGSSTGSDSVGGTSGGGVVANPGLCGEIVERLTACGSTQELHEYAELSCHDAFRQDPAGVDALEACLAHDTCLAFGRCVDAWLLEEGR